MNSLKVFLSLKIAPPIPPPPSHSPPLPRCFWGAPQSRLHLLPPALGQVQRAWVRQRPARIGAASPHSVSSPTSSNPAPQYPVSWPDDVLSNNCPPPSSHPVFHSLSTASSQVRPPFWKTSLPSPPRTQTGLYFLARPGGSPASIIAKVAGPPPSTPCSFLIAAAMSLLASFLRPARLSHIFLLLKPLGQRGGWEAAVPTMLELREDCHGRTPRLEPGSRGPWGQAHPCLFTSHSTEAGAPLFSLFLTPK